MIIIIYERIFWNYNNFFFLFVVVLKKKKKMKDDALDAGWNSKIYNNPPPPPPSALRSTTTTTTSTTDTKMTDNRKPFYIQVYKNINTKVNLEKLMITSIFWRQFYTYQVPGISLYNLDKLFQYPKPDRNDSISLTVLLTDEEKRNAV